MDIVLDFLSYNWHYFVNFAFTLYSITNDYMILYDGRSARYVHKIVENLSNNLVHISETYRWVKDKFYVR